MKNTVELLLSVIFFSCTTGCAYVGPSDPPFDANSRLAHDAFLSAPLNFASATEFVLRPKCMNCHSSALFKTAEVVRENARIINHVVFVSQSMPPERAAPEDQLTNCEREILRAFLSDGSPETSLRLVSDLPVCTAAPL